MVTLKLVIETLDLTYPKRIIDVIYTQILKQRIQAAMAEWLRRVIRNHLGSSRVGSNPARSVLFFI